MQWCIAHCSVPCAIVTRRALSFNSNNGIRSYIAGLPLTTFTHHGRDLMHAGVATSRTMRPLGPHPCDTCTHLGVRQIHLFAVADWTTRFLGRLQPWRHPMFGRANRRLAMLSLRVTVSTYQR